ncbi:cell wall elongation regulator TseB-like domain-containing protein [Paenibacillus koleovorans]|uniref:cell wall elongation regulator TseB-like domain-containing protein n=1 Tax=Paenibacillus koleovorans TaxID=121608 RepID=UPI000FD81F00|nr:DUF5590 domain-containing protein [Paenibacillus koleovorans]
MKKIVAAAFGLVIILIVLLFRFYLGVQREEWDTYAAAAQTVTENTYLSSVQRIATFQGEATYKIVFGTDEEGREGVAWVGRDSVHMEYLGGQDGGLTEAQIREKVLQKGADFEIERILPGILDGVYVWEAFYKRAEDGGTRYYYDYYRFNDGAEIDTWKLSRTQ